MATLAATNPTAMDIAKLMEPDGGVTTDVVEMLNQFNPFMGEATFVEANGKTFHRTSIRTGLPEPTWRQYYQGVQPTKSSYAQVDEPIGSMEARSQVDQRLLKHSGNPAQVRLIEAQGHLEGMSQSLVDTALYGSVTTSPAKFNGIMSRLNSTTAASGENVIDGGGTSTDNASILLINWSPRTVFFTYPQGSAVGVQRTNIGTNHQAEPPDGSSGKFTAEEEKFEQECGLVVKDWRHVVRAANIDVSNLVAESSAADILKLMAIMVDKIPSFDGGRAAFYVPRVISTMLRIQLMSKNNVYLTVGGEEGKKKTHFDGIPINRVDKMRITEDRVT
jgi:hypothetical protein